MVNRLDAICQEVARAVRNGVSLIILSDRNVSASRIPVRYDAGFSCKSVYKKSCTNAHCINIVCQGLLVRTSRSVLFY